MKHARLALSALAFVLLCSASSLATTPPAGAPAGTTGLCNDGTYTNFATKSGACAGHKGVKTWYGPAAAPKSTTTKPSLLSKLTSKSSTPAPAGSSPAPAPASTPSKPAPAAGSTGGAPAAGGGPGMVWVNTSTKVYHCPTDRYYGKTKNGQYLTEAAAQAAGDKPDAGKKCF